MDREILFRGKRIDKGEWIRGDLITTPFIRNETQQNIIYILDIAKADYDCFEDLVEDNGIFEIAPETVCQYTGLTDKNGRKIFEGDIVNCAEYECCGNISWNESEAGFCFCVLLDGGGFEEENLYDYVDELEVIGNIFDNPELLEGDIE